MSHTVAAPIVAALVAAFLLSLVHLQLYRFEHSKALLLWTIAWSFYTLRLVFALTVNSRPDSALLLWMNQSLAVASGVFLVWGTLVHTGRRPRTPRIWLAVSAALIVWLGLGVGLSVETTVLVTPVFVFLAGANLTIGLAYLRSISLDKASRVGVFVVFLLWGLHKLDYPILRGMPNAAAWGYTLGALFAVVAGIGLLFVYLNQERRLAGFSRSKFESLVSSVQDVVFTLDRQCRHTGIYGKWSADRGVSEEAFLGKTAAEIMGAPGTRHMEMAQTAFREQRPVTYEWSARTQDGTQRFYQTTLSPILTQNESPAEVVGVGRDITDLKRTQHQLEESLREKSTLLREVHHRVKNNLQLIVSLLNLRAASSGDEGTQQVLSELKSRVMAMALVHEQLYQAENLASIAFKDYLTEIVASVAEASSSRDGLTPAVSISADELHLTVEQALPLGLIAVELISNAVKHAGPCRGALAIAISFAATDGFVTLSVADNGPGLPEGFDTQRSETLGLALVQSLASQLDGDLVVNSAHGACFAVTIPAVPAVGD